MQHLNESKVCCRNVKCTSTFWCVTGSPVCIPCCCPHQASKRCPRCSDVPDGAASDHHKMSWRPKSDHQRSYQTPFQMHCYSEMLNKREREILIQTKYIYFLNCIFIILIFFVIIYMYLYLSNALYMQCHASKGNFCTTSAIKQNGKNSDISNRLNTPVCHWSTKQIVPPPNKYPWPNVVKLVW